MPPDMPVGYLSYARPVCPRLPLPGALRRRAFPCLTSLLHLSPLVYLSFCGSVVLPRHVSVLRTSPFMCSCVRVSLRACRCVYLGVSCTRSPCVCFPSPLRHVTFYVRAPLTCLIEHVINDTKVLPGRCTEGPSYHVPAPALPQGLLLPPIPLSLAYPVRAPVPFSVPASAFPQNQ